MVNILQNTPNKQYKITYKDEIETFIKIRFMYNENENEWNIYASIN